jgi:hypothetical protein
MRLHNNVQKRGVRAVVISDEGKEEAYTRLRRRMGAYNPIKSKYGSWGGGKAFRNITIDNILEDPLFKSSKRSHFIQMVDCCAFALLRSENPTPRAQKYGIDSAFDLLDPILVREANPNDPRGKGIIRP